MARPRADARGPGKAGELGTPLRDEAVDAKPAEHRRRGEAGRPGSDDEDVHFEMILRVHRGLLESDFVGQYVFCRTSCQVKC